MREYRRYWSRAESFRNKRGVQEREKGMERVVVTGLDCEQFTDSDKRLKDNASFTLPFFKRSF